MSKLKAFITALFLLHSLAIEAEEIAIHDLSMFPQKALTNPGCGRLGDQLLNYAGVKWLSYRYKVPVVLRYFDYSKELALSDLELCYPGPYEQWPIKMVDWRSYEQLQEANREKQVLIISAFAESKVEHKEAFPSHIRPDIDWEDPGFKAILRKYIAPKKPLALWSLPKNRITVAVHIRLGTGVDPSFAPISLPLKFPPLSWYKQQLVSLVKSYPNRSWYVYLFTDDPDPKKLYDQFKHLFAHNRVVYAYRAHENSHDKMVLEDLFSMARFDCIIHPMSNFSLIAAKIGDPAIEIYPSNYVRFNDGRAPKITETTVLRRKQL